MFSSTSMAGGDMICHIHLNGIQKYQRQVNVRASESHMKTLGKEGLENKETIFQNFEGWVVFEHN